MIAQLARFPPSRPGDAFDWPGSPVPLDPDEEGQPEEPPEEPEPGEEEKP